MTAVDLRLDDDVPEPSVPAKLAFMESPEPSAPPPPPYHSGPQNIEIVIKQFEKKGEGMGAYIVYKVVTTVSCL